VGILLLFSVMIFYRRRRDVPEYGPLYFHEDDETGESYEDIPLTSEVEHSSPPEDANAYIPVVRPKSSVPGLGKLELVHYIGKGALFSIDSLKDPSQIHIERNKMVPEIEGEVVLSSKSLIIFNSKNSRKIMLASIAKYYFRNSYLIIKRKNAKKKKDVLHIFENPADFRYILRIIS
jgi:hypothetical protein